jgi:hypothetical protein
MTPRTGLYVALVGLVIGVICGVAALLMANLTSGPPETWSDWMLPALIFAFFGLFIGFSVMLVGLGMAVVGAMMKPS